MQFLKQLLGFIRAIDLTAIGKAMLAKFGWLAQLLGGFFLKAAEKVLDRKIKDSEDALDVKKKDQEIEAEAAHKAQAIKEAKTDDDFDKAVRDSLR